MPAASTSAALTAALSTLFRVRTILVSLCALVVISSVRRTHRYILQYESSGAYRHPLQEFLRSSGASTTTHEGDAVWRKKLAAPQVNKNGSDPARLALRPVTIKNASTRVINSKPIVFSAGVQDVHRGGNEHGIALNHTEERTDFTQYLQRDEPNSPPWAVFYNVFVPDPTTTSIEAHTGALQIIEEQLGQIGRSYAALKYLSQGKTLRVFYNSIGTPVDPSWMQRVCSEQHDLKCHNLNHYHSAFEEVTLQRVHEYCYDFPTHKVIYMHSKGSYNSRGGKNQYWRRHMTHAVSHKDCLEPPDDSCNVCGLVFNPLPWIHFSGNFFTADCAYINKLLPLPEFRRKMDELALITRSHKNASRILFQTFPDKDAYLGLERYASENWPGSHPDLRACDLSKDREINMWKKARADESTANSTHPAGHIDYLLQFSLAPRVRETSGKQLMPARYRFDEGKRLREYYLLPGHMLKWQYLYHKIPSPASWVWQFYPDGEVWQTAYGQVLAEQNGKTSDTAEYVLRRVTEKYAALDRKKSLLATSTTGTS